ncbi:hypothetical protein [Elizabethkingia sp. JS20170427COW]|uniref:hypothetical protein n=1 Tax=Elizabethkingia sp. JS20170427COW TaxID=2583851 RepID=UPI001110A8BC|nr:hypothetical protein [Elizabethkingia sp. JS20170427COW]QCX52755.1 hypothetical protein FGE20_02825 [Elizabethkingia sp. JS20170427COW]
MKKRHKQKLVILSILLLILLNAPILLLFNSEKSILGIPIVFIYILGIWLLSIISSLLILKKFDE